MTPITMHQDFTYTDLVLHDLEKKITFSEINSQSKIPL